MKPGEAPPERPLSPPSSCELNGDHSISARLLSGLVVCSVVLEPRCQKVYSDRDEWNATIAVTSVAYLAAENAISFAEIIFFSSIRSELWTLPEPDYLSIHANLSAAEINSLKFIWCNSTWVKFLWTNSD